jgi:uncharacterized membrane protein YqgA involved in biofilm formation
MIGLGTIVNVITILVGSTIGLLLKKGLPERFKNIILESSSLVVVMIGISGVMSGMFKVTDEGTLSSNYIMVMIFSLVIGGLIGEFINIDDKLDKLGNWFQSKFSNDGSSFSLGFVTASLVFCVGAMAIVGALEDGLTGNASTLYAKAVIDGITSIVFASNFGIGVAFSALPILVYQGGITLMAVWIKPWLTLEVITQMSLVGSVLIFCLGMGMLGIKKFKVGNLLPAIFMPLIYYVICSLIA